MNVFQIIILIITKNYILFLILQIIFTWLENFFVSKKADSMYPYLKDKNVDALDKKEISNIKKNVGAMVFHKIGGMVVNSTDNIIMSRIVGLVAVGIYSNYFLIIQALETITGQIFNAITASVGNLNATQDKNHVKTVFNRTLFMNFWVFSFCSICLIVLFNDFITLWLGKEYLFSFSIVVVLCICFYLKGIRKTVLTFRDATGIFYYDRYKPIIESVINLIVSILLANELGVLGVFLGTIISTVTTSLWVEPYILYKYVFNMSVKDYFKRLISYSVIGILVCVFTYYICSFFTGLNWFILVLKLFITIVFVNIIFILVFRKSQEFKYYCGLFKKMFKLLSNKMKKVD